MPKVMISVHVRHGGASAHIYSSSTIRILIDINGWFSSVATPV